MTKQANGQGSIFLWPNGRYCVKVIVRGEAVRRFAKTRTEAQRLLRELNAGKINGQILVGRSPTVAAYMNAWIDERDPLLPQAGVAKLAYATIGGYRRRAAHLLATIGDVQLRNLEPAEIRRALAAISAKGLSSTTVSDCRVFLATVLKSAMRERPPKVAFNAAELVDHIKRDDTEKYALDETEANRFLAAAKAHGRLYSALLVAVHLGPRAGELWGARWSAIDWNKGTLHISSSLYWIGAGANTARTFAMKPPKTEHGDRVIRLSKAALAALKAHHDTEAHRLGKVPHRDAFIWTDEKGGPVDHRNVLRDVFYPICKAAEIPFVGAHDCVDPEHGRCPAFLTFHGLRHSAATLALAATKDVLAVSRMLGHASTEFTMDVYGHVLEKQQREIADYMDAAVVGR